MALGRLTEAVNGLRRDMTNISEQRADLSRRVGVLERWKAWVTGAIGIMTGVVSFLGYDRITKIFH